VQIKEISWVLVCFWVGNPCALLINKKKIALVIKKTLWSFGENMA
jgi:hypothetical protein